MFDYIYATNYLHKELLNLDWTAIGWICLGICCILMHLSIFFKIGPGSQRVSTYDENTTETNELIQWDLVYCDLV